MPDVNGITLAMAIRAIDDKMWQLREQMQGIGPGGEEYERLDMEYLGYMKGGEEYERLDMEYLGYMKAAHALRSAYEEACETTANLLPYANLVREP